MEHLWSHPPDECDVANRATLLEYRSWAGSWHSLLHGNKHQSITSQISEMMWNDAAWRAMNEARRFVTSDQPNAAVSPILAKLLDQGYISGQVLAISRLLEKSNPKDPQKGVVSIRRLLDELWSNKHIFTREIYVSHDGLPYDWESACREFYSASNVESFQRLDTNGPRAWGTSKARHEEFDRLSNHTSSMRRSRNDCLGDEIFQHLSDILRGDVFSDILSIRNKSVAHAADSFSRQQVKNLRSGIKLEEFSRAHFLIIGIYQAISSNILFGNWRANAVPTPQLDQFEHLNRAFVASDRLDDLYEFWSTHCDEREKWMLDAYHHVLGRT